jgi:hypothetical protein
MVNRISLTLISSLLYFSLAGPAISQQGVEGGGLTMDAQIEQITRLSRICGRASRTGSAALQTRCRDCGYYMMRADKRVQKLVDAGLAKCSAAVSSIEPTLRKKIADQVDEESNPPKTVEAAVKGFRRISQECGDLAKKIKKRGSRRSANACAQQCKIYADQIQTSGFNENTKMFWANCLGNLNIHKSEFDAVAQR